MNSLKFIRFRARRESLLSLTVMLLLRALLIAVCFTTSLEASEKSSVDLTELSLEDLMQIKVTSVSKKPQKVSESAAAIFVITQEDIRRSGVTSIPEALRMAPGLQVARIDSNKWAISPRGFGDRYANKLLVLMDGRSVYTPLFSGVYWDMQGTLLEDIDRIEVIRGPGATMWGANAVNGVINIITKKAQETQGGLVTAGGGTEERGFGSFRYGAKIGDATYYRLYAKYFNRDEAVQNGDGADDEWNKWQAGFRMDWEGPDNDSLTVQGDLYKGDMHENMLLPLERPPYVLTERNEGDAAGAYMLARWNHVFSDSSDLTLQLYYDWYKYGYELLLEENRHTFDLDLQHRFTLGRVHQIVWGSGYRFTHDAIDNTPMAALDPDSANDHLMSAFLQDDIMFKQDRMRLTLGSKFEHNDYTGFEVQPTARLLLTPTSRHSLWMAISRAVRTPSRGEHALQAVADVIVPRTLLNPTRFPVFLDFMGSSDMHAEELLACEIGYRAHLQEGLSVDIAGFYNDYDNLMSVEPRSPRIEMLPRPGRLIIPAMVGNKQYGNAYGVEISIDWIPSRWWQIKGSYAYFQMQLHPGFDSKFDDMATISENKSPHQQLSLRSLMDFPKNVEFDLWLRYVDSLSTIKVTTGGAIITRIISDVDRYLTLDVRFGWRPTKNLEISIVGQNLLDNRHLEFSNISLSNILPTEVERRVYGKVTLRF